MTPIEKTLAERVEELEKLCTKQSGQIEAIGQVLADVLAAQMVLGKDVRLLRLIDDFLVSDRKKLEAGGTERTPVTFFEARFDGRAEFLHRVFKSQVFDNYWFQSVFYRREQGQRDHLEKIRAAVLAVINKHGI